RQGFHFGPAYHAPHSEGVAHEVGRRVARLPHDVKDSHVLFGHRVADIARPGLVGDGRAGPLQLFGNVEEDEVAAAYGRAVDGGGLVVRVRRVRARGDVRPVVGHALFGEAADDELLYVVLGRLLVRVDAAGDLGEGFTDDAVELVGGLPVHGELFGRPRGL